MRGSVLSSSASLTVNSAEGAEGRGGGLFVIKKRGVVDDLNSGRRTLVEPLQAVENECIESTNVDSEQFLELLDCHPCVFDNSAHCERINRIRAGNDDNSLAIGH